MLESPRFRDENARVLVELPLRARVTQRERAWLLDLEQRGALETGDKLVLVRAARGETMTNGRVRDLLGLDSRDARALLRRLRDAGIVRQQGTRGGASYILESDFAPPQTRLMDLAGARERVLQLAAEAGLVSNRDVRALLDVDADFARRLLQELVSEGLLVQEGATRSTHYRAAN